MNIITYSTGEYRSVATSHNAKRWYGYPGAYQLGENIYTTIDIAKEALAKPGWQRTLLVHEVRHYHGVPDHPNDPINAIIEAIKYGFDERAFTRYLRWRKSTHYAEAEKLLLAELEVMFNG